jgi:hypothetical protein
MRAAPAPSCGAERASCRDCYAFFRNSVFRTSPLDLPDIALDFARFAGEANILDQHPALQGFGRAFHLQILDQGNGAPLLSLTTISSVTIGFL